MLCTSTVSHCTGTMVLPLQMQVGGLYYRRSKHKPHSMLKILCMQEHRHDMFAARWQKKQKGPNISAAEFDVPKISLFFVVDLKLFGF